MESMNITIVQEDDSMKNSPKNADSAKPVEVWQRWWRWLWWRCLWRLRPFLPELTILVCLSGLLAAGIIKLKGSTVWELEASTFCILIYILPAGGIMAKWAMDAVVFLVGRFESRRLNGRRTAHLLVGLRKSGIGLIWVVVVLVAWEVIKVHWVKRGPSKETRKALDHVTRALAGVLVGVILWMVKTLLMECLALHFIVHRSEDKIKEIRREGRLLKFICEKIGVQKHESIIDEFNATKETGYARDWTPKYVVDEIYEIKLPIFPDIEFEDTFTVDRYAAVTADKIFDRIADECGKLGGLYSRHSNKCRYIIKEKPPGEKGQNLKAILDKLEPVISPVRPLNDEAQNERYMKSDFRKWVVKLFLQQMLLVRTLSGRDQIVGHLNRIVSSVVLVIVFVLWWIIMGWLTMEVLVLIASQLLALNFMFSDSAKTVFESILFVFVTQPFDVGDFVKFDDKEMVVFEMNLLGTVFEVTSEEKVTCPNSVLTVGEVITKVYSPNSALMGKDITNFYFVPDPSESLEFNIDINTPKGPIEQLQTRIKEYVIKSKHWNNEQYNFKVEKEEHYGINTKSVVLDVYHTISFCNREEKTKHRNELASELKNHIKDLEIKLCQS